MNSSKIKEYLKYIDYYSLFTPQNLLEEKQKFLSYFSQNIEYNPTFSYKQIDVEKIKELQLLLSVRSENSLKNILSSQLVDICEIVLLLSSTSRSQKDCDKVTELTAQLFGNVQDFSEVEIRKLYEQSSQSSGNEKGQMIKSSDLIELYKTALTDFNLDGWKLVDDKNRLSYVSVNSESKEIILNLPNEISEIEGNRLLFHEIYGHVFQAENSKQNIAGNPDFFSPEILDLFQALGNETQSEGFALFTELNNIGEKVFDSMVNRYCVFMLANKYALTASFFKVYKEIFSLTGDQELSFLACCRAKRGFQDSSYLGCFQKENSYLYGLFLVLQNLFENPENLKKIMGLKFPFAALEHIPNDLTITVDSNPKLNTLYLKHVYIKLGKLFHEG
jgi:hypothetical protein